LAAALDYDSRATPEVILQAHRTLGGLHGAAVRGAAPGLPALKTIDPGAGRVRVGFLSADFRDHPVGMFIEPALRPDPERAPSVGVSCYDRTARRDGFSERLRAGGAVWREVAQASDAALVSAVREDGIDVLIELSGHSIGNRQTALA